MGEKGQSTLEFMVLIAIVVAAIICMQGYVKRSIQGRVRNYADQVGDGNLYSPGLTTSNSTITITSTEKTTTEPKLDEGGEPIEGMSITTTTQDIGTVTTRTESIGPLADEP